jgi:hypothetical protein
VPERGEPPPCTGESGRDKLCPDWPWAERNEVDEGEGEGEGDVEEVATGEDDRLRLEMEGREEVRRGSHSIEAA